MGAGSRDQRTALRAPHDRVDVAVDVAVQRVRAGGRQRSADESDQDQPHRRQASVGQHHRRQRRDEQQLDDAGLGEQEQAPGDEPRPATARPVGLACACLRRARRGHARLQCARHPCHSACLRAVEPSPRARQIQCAHSGGQVSRHNGHRVSRHVTGCADFSRRRAAISDRSLCRTALPEACWRPVCRPAAVAVCARSQCARHGRTGGWPR